MCFTLFVSSPRSRHSGRKLLLRSATCHRTCQHSSDTIFTPLARGDWFVGVRSGGVYRRRKRHASCMLTLFLFLFLLREKILFFGLVQFFLCWESVYRLLIHVACCGLGGRGAFNRRSHGTLQRSRSRCCLGHAATNMAVYVRCFFHFLLSLFCCFLCRLLYLPLNNTPACFFSLFIWLPLIIICSRCRNDSVCIAERVAAYLRHLLLRSAKHPQRRFVAHTTSSVARTAAAGTDLGRPRTEATRVLVGKCVSAFAAAAAAGGCVSGVGALSGTAVAGGPANRYASQRKH